MARHFVILLISIALSAEGVIFPNKFFKESLVSKSDFSETDIIAIQHDMVERVIQSLEWLHPEVCSKMYYMFFYE